MNTLQGENCEKAEKDSALLLIFLVVENRQTKKEISLQNCQKVEYFSEFSEKH